MSACGSPGSCRLPRRKRGRTSSISTRFACATVLVGALQRRQTEAVATSPNLVGRVADPASGALHWWMTVKAADVNLVLAFQARWTSSRSRFFLRSRYCQHYRLVNLVRCTHRRKATALRSLFRAPAECVRRSRQVLFSIADLQSASSKYEPSCEHPGTVRLM